MSKRGPSRIGHTTVALFAVVAVFALATAMIMNGYDATVITAVVTTTSIAAAELIRTLRGGPRPEAGSGTSGES